MVTADAKTGETAAAAAAAAGLTELIAECVREGRAAGCLRGDGCEADPACTCEVSYELMPGDCDYIEAELGHRPTRAEWAAAGYPAIGSRHVADDAEPECAWNDCRATATATDADGDRVCAGHVHRATRDENPGPVAWTDVPLHTNDGAVDYGNNPTRVRLLAEYRRARRIAGAWLATAEQLDAAEDEGTDPADLGPSVERIDWTGFPADDDQKEGAAR